ncbi:MAG: hypothetical protein GXO33_03320 [Epsilonproteobacteria bacterium]|nr:hypothetical protein [Campylobacterota bacterium]
MEEQNQLDDLILKKSKQGNLKKMLLAASILLLVLILIILVTKSLVEPEKKETSSIALPPEPTVAQTKKAPPKEPLFEEVPIEEENQPADAPIDRIIRNVKAQEAQTPEPTQTAQTKPTAQPEPQAKPTHVAKTETKPAPVKKATQPAKAKPVTKSVQPKKRSASASKRPTRYPSGTTKAYASLASGYYIQVGAFRTDPNRKFLKTIEKEGFPYILMTSTRNGVKYKKVIIGPYASRAEAKRALPQIKRRVNQNAYIFRKK